MKERQMRMAQPGVGEGAGEPRPPARGPIRSLDLTRLDLT